MTQLFYLVNDTEAREPRYHLTNIKPPKDSTQVVCGSYKIIPIDDTAEFGDCNVYFKED